MLAEDIRLLGDKRLFITQNTNSGQISAFLVAFPWTPIPTGKNNRAKWHKQWNALQENNSEFKKPESFIMISKYACALLWRKILQGCSLWIVMKKFTFLICWLLFWYNVLMYTCTEFSPFLSQLIYLLYRFCNLL